MTFPWSGTEAGLNPKGPERLCRIFQSLKFFGLFPIEPRPRLPSVILRPEQLLTYQFHFNWPRASDAGRSSAAEATFESIVEIVRPIGHVVNY